MRVYCGRQSPRFNDDSNACIRTEVERKCRENQNLPLIGYLLDVCYVDEPDSPVLAHHWCLADIRSSTMSMAASRPLAVIMSTRWLSHKRTLSNRRLRSNKHLAHSGWCCRLPASAKRMNKQQFMALAAFYIVHLRFSSVIFHHLTTKTRYGFTKIPLQHVIKLDLFSNVLAGVAGWE